MPAARKVSVHNAHPALRFRQADVKALYRHLDVIAPEELSIPGGELSIAFVDAESICRMHEEFLNDPTITDVITFPGDPDEKLAGEICVCADYAMQQAPNYGHSLSEELTLYLVHGWLHLAGRDDLTDEARPLMRQSEAVAMAAIKSAGLIPDFKLRKR